MAEQAEETVVIKVIGKNLVVPKRQLTKDSLKFRELFDELNLADHEIYDFTPEVVEYFINLLKTEELDSIEESMFRELHKLSVVFEVQWLRDKCREWLAKKIESAKYKEDKKFLLEECWFIFDKWRDNAIIDELISELAHQDNLDLLPDYLSDISQLKTGQIDMLLNLGGGYAEFFLENILHNLAGQKTLNSKVKYLLDNMNLALCSEVNEDLYLEVMDKISDLQEISLNDLRSVHQLMLNVAGQVRTRKKSFKGRTRRLDLSIMVSMISGIELLLPKFIGSTHEYIGETDKIVEILREYLSELENFRDTIKYIKVPRKYLNNLIAAAKFSDHINSNFLINALEKVKSNKRLCSNIEITIIKMEKIISYK